MIPDKCIWVFNGNNNRFPSGVFLTIDTAEKWIKRHKLTGILAAYPIDEGAFDWSLRNNMLNLRHDKIETKSKDPEFIGNFSNASFDHYHYESGTKK